MAGLGSGPSCTVAFPLASRVPSSFRPSAVTFHEPMSSPETLTERVGLVTENVSPSGPLPLTVKRDISSDTSLGASSFSPSFSSSVSSSVERGVDSDLHAANRPIRAAARQINA